MKKIFLPLFAGLVFMACSSPQPTKTTPRESIVYPINEPYTVTAREVRQGSKYAIAKSSTEIAISYFRTNTAWRLTTPIAHLPALSAPNSPLIAALYNMALEESIENIRQDRTFMAGEKWHGVWTRDISYSIHLALAAIHPEISRRSLFAKVNTNGRFIIQDTGTGGSWPISTDRVVWSLAAREYLAWHNDTNFLREAYEVMKNTALADRHAAFEARTGLYHGESSFMDWREQSYASWMQPVDIYMSFSFSTCVLHYNHLRTLGWMARQLRLTTEATQWETWARNLRTAIRTNFYEPAINAYASYIYPSPISTRAMKTDNLGLALAVLTGIAEPAEIPAVVESIPVVPFGVVSLWPQQPHAGYYHNKGIWPFVGAYYVLAAREAGNLEAVTFGFKAMTRAAALLGTHKENFSYDRGHTDRMHVNSDRQLWSVAGYLALVYRVLFGITVDETGMRFRPMVPEFIEGPLTLSNLSYHEATLTITVEGNGDTIETMTVNGENVPPTTRINGHAGRHYDIVIKLARRLPPQSIRLVSTDDISPPEPRARLDSNVVGWRSVRHAKDYTVFFNSALITTTTATEIPSPKGTGVLTVKATTTNRLHSTVGLPLWIIPDDRRTLIELEALPSLQPLSTNRHRGFTGEGYVLLDNEGTIAPEVRVPIAQAGLYLIRFRYANGNGPINTDNRCGIRTLTINGRNAGVIVFPQRGAWTAWGHSSHLMVRLPRGNHTLRLVKTPLDNNMNQAVNQAALDSLEIILWE